MNKKKTMTGEELGKKLLKSVRQMKAGKVSLRTAVAPPLATSARMRTGLSQTECFVTGQMSDKAI